MGNGNQTSFRLLEPEEFLVVELPFDVETGGDEDVNKKGGKELELKVLGELPVEYRKAVRWGRLRGLLRGV